MKRVKILIFSAFVLLSAAVNTQTINQKLITGIPAVNGTVDAYSLKYDAATGGWVYSAYDTSTTKNTIITPKGSSKPFNYAMTYNALFDSDGNSYVTGSENISDTVYSYSVLKNNEVIAEYEYLTEGWVIKDNIIYYAAQENGKYYLIKYDTKSGQFTKGKAYDNIRLSYTPMGYYEGEPLGYVGFTAAGEPYYIATEGNDVFLVIGETEQKKYSDITWYDMKFNPQGEPCYIAKSQGKFYEERGNTFMVQGTKEYKSFDWIYGPVEFDNNGTPMYVGQDSTGEYKYRSTLMRGGEEIASNNGSIYNYGFTPQGKLYYITSEEVSSKDGVSQWKSAIVVDGKRGKEFTSINSPVFNKKGDILFSASDKNNKYLVYLNGEAISDKYDYINDAKFMPNGTISYAGTNYGNYEKNIPDKNIIVIDEEEFGPYNIVNTADWTTNQLILTGGNNWAFISGKLIDKANYTYKYNVVTNKNKSKEFDIISDLKYVNSKLVYFAGNLKDKESYTYEYTLYVNDKKLGESYSAYTDVKVNDNGTMTFIASKGNEIYLVEAKP